KPETIATYEAVYEQGFGPHLKFSAAGFYYRIDGLIDQTTDANGLTIYDNLDRARAYGGEFGLEGKHPSGFRGRVSYTVQRADDVSSGQELSNSPRHLAKLNLIVPLYPEKLFAGLEVQYSSSTKTIVGTSVKSYYVANLTLFSREIVKNLEFSGSIYNLFNN